MSCSCRSLSSKGTMFSGTMFRTLALATLMIGSGLLLAATSGAMAADPPYEKKLVRLAEVLGSIHYLRNLCGEKGTGWRDEMEALLKTEKPDPDRRAKLIASFNRGYRSFGGVYSECTDSAVTAIGRYMTEGEGLSREIVTRYRN